MGIVQNVETILFYDFLIGVIIGIIVPGKTGDVWFKILEYLAKFFAALFVIGILLNLPLDIIFSDISGPLSEVVYGITFAALILLGIIFFIGLKVGDTLEKPVKKFLK